MNRSGRHDLSATGYRIVERHRAWDLGMADIKDFTLGEDVSVSVQETRTDDNV